MADLSKEVAELDTKYKENKDKEEDPRDHKRRITKTVKTVSKINWQMITNTRDDINKKLDKAFEQIKEID